MWALSIKRALGNVYHLQGYTNPPRAHCDHRIRLDEKAYERPPEDGYVCGRCKNIEWQKNRDALKTA